VEFSISCSLRQSSFTVLHPERMDWIGDRHANVVTTTLSEDDFPGSTARLKG